MTHLNTGDVLYVWRNSVTRSCTNVVVEMQKLLHILNVVL